MQFYYTLPIFCVIRSADYRLFCVRWEYENVVERQTDGAPPKVWARLEQGNKKFPKPLWGGREKVLEKFSKDGSRWPCMHASFGTENKSWRVTSACMNEKQNQNTSVVTWRRKETKGE
jgi:hypothetical protein